jgi:hypothetical protein
MKKKKKKKKKKKPQWTIGNNGKTFFLRHYTRLPLVTYQHSIEQEKKKKKKKFKNTKKTWRAYGVQALLTRERARKRLKPSSITTQAWRAEKENHAHKRDRRERERERERREREHTKSPQKTTKMQSLRKTHKFQHNLTKFHTRIDTYYSSHTKTKYLFKIFLNNFFIIFFIKPKLPY